MSCSIVSDMRTKFHARAFQTIWWPRMRLCRGTSKRAGHRPFASDAPFKGRQSLDPADIEAREGIAHAHARDDPLGRDLGERQQHEGALEQPWMRKREPGLV